MKSKTLIELAKSRFDETDTQLVQFTGIDKVDNLLNDLDIFPHAFVLACLMDRQIKAERAWEIPFKVFKKLEAYKISELSKINLEEYIKLFEAESLHRFNKKMAEVFFKAVFKIKNDYEGDISKIWNNNPSSASVVYKF